MSSSTQTTSYDERVGREKNPIWKEVLTFTFASGDSAEEKLAVVLHGFLRKIIVKCSGASGASVTATVAIDDSGDNEIFNKDSLAESTTYKYDVDEPLTGEIDIGVLPSTDPLSAYTVTVTLRGV